MQAVQNLKTLSNSEVHVGFFDYLQVNWHNLQSWNK